MEPAARDEARARKRRAHEGRPHLPQRLCGRGLPGCNLIFDWYAGAAATARARPAARRVGVALHTTTTTRAYGTCHARSCRSRMWWTSPWRGTPPPASTCAPSERIRTFASLHPSAAQPDAQSGTPAVELQVRTLESSDEGVAFLVRTQGRTLMLLRRPQLGSGTARLGPARPLTSSSAAKLQASRRRRPSTWTPPSCQSTHARPTSCGACLPVGG